jgi:3-oxoacyl-[acyl-carrier protein] reductase
MHTTHPPSGLDLSGRRAFVTGAARGMGIAHSRLLVERGARVAMVDVDAAELEGAAGEIGSDVTALAGDITDRPTAERLVEQAAEWLGGLDVMVHNAGRMHSSTGLAETDDADVEALFAVNVYGPLYLTRSALPYLHASPAGRVIFISSQWGQVPAGHSYGYMCSKAAQLGMMKTMATELAGEKILVNAIAPGSIRTRMVPNPQKAEAAVPIGRLGEPDDISQMVAFLASDAGSFITGQTIPVNGGACIVGI